MLRYVIRLSSSICGFDNCVNVCVSALVAMVCISSASGLMLILIVTLWVCW